jgi:hypothetical protein
MFMRILPKHIDNRARQLLEGRMRAFLNASIERHTQGFGNSAPFFVTYYHKNANSTTDPNLGNANQAVGPESPTRFVKINDFPLYKFESTFTSLEMGDLGPESKMEGKAVVIPGMIQPEDGDFFSISVASTIHLFIVTKASADRMHQSEKYWEIEYELSPYNIENIEQQVQVKAQLYPDRYLRGTGLILEETAAMHLEIIEETIETLRDWMIEWFGRHNMVVPPNYTYTDGKRPVLMELSYMVGRHNMLNKTMELNSNVALIEPWTRGRQTDILRAYRSSWFSHFDREQFEPHTIPQVDRPVPAAKLHMSKSIYDNFSSQYGAIRGDVVGFTLLQTIDPAGVSVPTHPLISQDLHDRILNGNVYTEAQYLLHNVLILWQNNGFESVSTYITSTNNIVDDVLLCDDLELYYIVPTALLVLTNTSRWLRSKVVNYLPT